MDVRKYIGKVLSTTVKNSKVDYKALLQQFANELNSIGSIDELPINIATSKEVQDPQMHENKSLGGSRQFSAYCVVTYTKIETK